MARKHQSGPNSKNPGTWVNCPAQHSCRNNSVHINSDVLYPARKLHEMETGEKIGRVSDLPLEIVTKYIDAPEDVKEKTVDALVHDERIKDEKAAKRDPNRYFADTKYATLKRVFMNSHNPPVMKEKTAKVIKSKAVPHKRVITGELTRQNVEAIHGMIADINIKDDNEMNDALMFSFRKVANLTDQQKKTLIWAMNDLRATRPRAGGQTPGLFQALQANMAINLIKNMIDANKQGDLATSRRIFNALNIYYEKVIEEDEKLKEAQKLREIAKQNKLAEAERKAAAKHARKLSTRIKNLFKNPGQEASAA